jgi:hypothetical protein
VSREFVLVRRDYVNISAGLSGARSRQKGARNRVGELCGGRGFGGGVETSVSCSMRFSMNCNRTWLRDMCRDRLMMEGPVLCGCGVRLQCRG